MKFMYMMIGVFHTKVSRDHRVISEGYFTRIYEQRDCTIIKLINYEMKCQTDKLTCGSIKYFCRF